MLKELFESGFFILYPPKQGAIVNLIEYHFCGKSHLYDIKACADCRDICNTNPANREQFRFSCAHVVHALKIDQMLDYIDVGNTLRDNCDYILDDGNKICLIEMTCATQQYAVSKRTKCRSQFWNTITLLRNYYPFCLHIENEQKYVIFSWRETFTNIDKSDIVEVNMREMTALVDDVYSIDNESNFDNSFKYKEIRYPDIYQW